MGEHKFKQDKEASIVLTPEQQAKIARDKALPCAVECSAAPLDAVKVGEMIEASMTRLNARALAAGMAIVNTSSFQSMTYDTSYQGVAVMFTTIAQWIDRDKLEAMQRQQALMGGGPTPRGRA